METPNERSLHNMSLSQTGFFAIHRSIWDSTAFRPEPFTEREAWIWMLSSAAWKDQTVRVGDHEIELERGQICYSTRYMAQAFGWHHSKLRRFLDRLEVRNSISRKTDTPTDTPTDTAPTQHRHK